jgi:hypothetical protein
MDIGPHSLPLSINSAPNTALQRTRSAPLRSPLSFKPLGGVRRQAWRWLRVVPLVAVVGLTSGCNDTTNVLTAAVPADVLSFQVAQETGLVLWRIESAVPLALEKLRYGQVPSGFRQVVPPPPAVPRPLKDGEQLVTETVEPTRTFKHFGTAIGSAGFLGGGWESTPKRRPTVQASRG